LNESVLTLALGCVQLLQCCGCFGCLWGWVGGLHTAALWQLQLGVFLLLGLQVLGRGSRDVELGLCCWCDSSSGFTGVHCGLRVGDAGCLMGSTICLSVVRGAGCAEGCVHYYTLHY
jgi:hypothetical protein